MTKQDWFAVLKLATKWNFKEFRSTALEKLTIETMDPVEKVLLARAYSIPQWLRTGYNMLATRNESLSVAEAKEIGYPIAIRVCQIREKIEVFSRENYPSLVSRAYKAVEREFREELRQVGMVCDPIVETPTAARKEDRPDKGKGEFIGKKKGKKKKV
jgi:hypothetical protein